MIEAEHSLIIDADIVSVWNYVQHIEKWANLFPGCRECEIIDEHNSKWVIKVGAGGLVKTVNVLVTVDKWDGPQRVDFSFRLEKEPVVGSGFYTAAPQGDKSTEILLHVEVAGSGQMAAMWEAMSRPLLPQMAKTFATRLKKEIEENAEGVEAAVPQPAPRQSALSRFRAWFVGLWRGR